MHDNIQVWYNSSPLRFYLINLFINFLWNSLLSKSLTNSPFLGLSSIPTAWFLKIKSSSHLLLTANVDAVDVVDRGLSVAVPRAAWRFIRGLPVAISASRDMAALEAASASYRTTMAQGQFLAKQSKVMEMERTRRAFSSARSCLIFASSAINAAVSSSSSESSSLLLKEVRP